MTDNQTTQRRAHEAAMPDKDRPRAPSDHTSEQMKKKRDMRKRDVIIFEKRYRDEADPFFT